MAYRITVREDGVLDFVGAKALTFADGEQMGRDFGFFLATATAADPLRVLFSSGRGPISPLARRAVIDLIGDGRVEKLALLKPNNFDRIMATVALKRSSRDHVRLFTSEVEALAWLKG